MNKNPSSNGTQIIAVSILLGLGVLLLIGLLAFAFRGSIMQAITPATPTIPIPTLFVPTPDCGSPTLLLGTSLFQIQDLTPAQDGSWTIPADTSGIAYLVQGTDTNPVFVVNPTPQNSTNMATISIGTAAKVTWKNCNSSTYNLSAPQAGTLDISALSANQAAEGVTVFFETDVSGAGFIYKGELTEQQISTINTPAPSDVQAEISLLETTASQDGTSLQISISINNYGTTPITLSANDLSLVQADSTALTMISSKPALPKQIEAGKMATINFTFPKPASTTATLKVFTAEYDIDGY